MPDLAASIRFYSDLFGMPPSVEKPDYAKWMLDEPRVNFAISHRTSRTGLNHLGLQAESAEELRGDPHQFAAADPEKVFDEPNVNCCYARGNKHWTKDPRVLPGKRSTPSTASRVYGDADEPAEVSACGITATQCCGPASNRARPAAVKKACCA